MTDTTLYQGDSSDTVETSVYSNDTLVTDLTGYVGKFSIVANLGDAPLVEKDMVTVGGKFRSQLAPADTASLELGVYIGVIEVSNADLLFKREEHITVTINKQGYGT